MIKLTCRGDWSKTLGFLRRCEKVDVEAVLRKYGEAGVEALSAATPKHTGLAAGSWYYEIERGKERSTIRWANRDMEGKGGWFNVAVMIQLGHGTRNGGYVKGIDYINPALRPIFDAFADACYREVTGS